MAYYLVDENNIRTYYETQILLQTTDKGIFVNNVKYEVNNKTLYVESARPLNSNAYVLTTNGLMKWKNPTKEIEKNGNVYFNEIRSSDLIEGTNGRMAFMFCSNYICLGTIPSNYIKINGKDIKLINFQINGDEWTVEDVKSPNELGVIVEEKENELTLDFTKTDIAFAYDAFGIQIGDKIYAFGLSIRVFRILFQLNSKIVITKGTCFKSNIIVLPDEKPIVVQDNTLHELCFDR